ncbi:MAG: FAD/NAD(P)-binding protein, partial [Spirochaetes bacterium]|nr:FAD/NAD(P)-binding protein [Spirochaetota bacterium]
MKKQILNNSEYRIKRAKVLRTKKMTDAEKIFEITLPDGESLDHDPGQFVEVSLFGVGEAPISIASSPTVRNSFDLCVRAVGKVTNEMHKLESGDEIGIRGPFGQGFPIRILEGNDLLFVAGGLGIVPMRSLINYVIDNRRDFGKVNILLGCKTPEDMLFGDEVKNWEKRLDVNFNCTVDRADPDWAGNVGLITSLIPGINLDPHRTFAIV